MHPNPRRIAPVLLVLLLGGTALWWYFQQSRASAQSGPLTASGTIETTQVVLAPEVGGHAIEVTVQEGDQVKRGQILIRFDDALLQAQLSQAQAALHTAQANYELVSAGPSPEQQTAAIAKAEMDLTSARQATKTLLEKSELMSAQSAKNVADAKNQLDRAEKRVESLETPVSQTDIDIAKSIVILTEEGLERAQKAFKQLLRKPEDNPRRAAALLAVSLLEKQHDQAVRRLNFLEGTPNDLTMERAHADLDLAQANLEETERQNSEMDSGPDPDELAMAEAAVNTAEAQLALAESSASPEQLNVAQAQVDSAKAAVGVIKAQMLKLVLASPLDGIVLVRSVEEGEVVLPGTPLITLGKLADLKITVYVPEDRYGSISLGQNAEVRVDSFPGKIFTASVIRISDQAEFTPRNVQTEEGRRTTVFAVDLAVEDSQGQLKPGMPADVTFK